MALVDLQVKLSLMARNEAMQRHPQIKQGGETLLVRCLTSGHLYQVLQMTALNKYLVGRCTPG